MLNSSQLVGGIPTAGFNRVLLKTTTSGTSTITVPDGVFVIKVKCWGGSGFSNQGGFSEAVIPVTPGETLTHVTGAAITGGVGQGGGGYSGLFRGAASQANSLIVAGGGANIGSSSGGSGGGATGQSGVAAGAAQGGGGGTQAGPGTGGAGTFSGSAGSGMNGGAGGNTGGGGGYGYYGGGGGGDSGSGGASGGGGSGFTSPSALAALTQQGPRTVDIDYVAGIGISGAGVGRGMVVIRA